MCAIPKMNSYFTNRYYNPGNLNDLKSVLVLVVVRQDKELQKYE